MKIWFSEKNYNDTSFPLPVLYLLHGNGGDENDWEPVYSVLDSLVRTGTLAPLAAVAPASGTSWWVDGAVKYETAFFQDLLPYVSEKFNLSTERNSRALAGFSMGGYGALHYALKYPHLFSSSILLSPALYNELPPDDSSARESGAFGTPFSAALWSERNYPALLISYLRQPEQTFIFIGAGDDDWNHENHVQYNIEYQALLLYSMLNKQHKNPAELRIINGGHDWALWLPLFKEGMHCAAKYSAGFSVDR